MVHTLFSTLLLAALATAQTTYKLTETYNNANFFSKMDFFTAADPTHGFVNYLDYYTAVSQKLIPNPGVASWGVDQTTKLSTSSSTGRASIRMTSKTRYNKGLFIADISHMPGAACGVWPAWWFFGQTATWPNGGEIDILEGVNKATTNVVSAHTIVGCGITNEGQTGSIKTSDCAVATSTTGCSVADSRPRGYGDGFNANGGGIYALQWTSNFMKVWFFPRHGIPASVSSGTPTPAKDWGAPVAIIQSKCNIDKSFYDLSFVFDTTFCGDYAGNTYQSAGCPMTSGQASMASCNTYVANNPSAFAESYWTVNSIKVYQRS